MASPIDNIFEKIFGTMPIKTGTAFELLAAIATFVIEESDGVRHDAFINGAQSGTRYQIDVLQHRQDAVTMGEAKDYSAGGKKVGRPDLQKLAGALVDLPDISEGIFWSATDYSTPARKYAERADAMIGKKIQLRGLRESTECDEHGFVKTIRITGTYHIPQLNEATWEVHYTPDACKALLSTVAGEASKNLIIEAELEGFYDAQGNLKSTLYELTRKGYGVIGEDGVCRCCYWLPDHYIQVNGILASIRGLEYRLPYKTQTTVIEITDNSTNRLVVLDETGQPMAILTDEQLRKFSFDDQGNLIIPHEWGDRSARRQDA